MLVIYTSYILLKLKECEKVYTELIYARDLFDKELNYRLGFL